MNPLFRLWRQNLIQLVETAPAKNDLWNHFKITKFHFNLLSAKFPSSPFR